MCSSGRAETLAKGAELAVVPVRTRAPLLHLRVNRVTLTLDPEEFSRFATIVGEAHIRLGSRDELSACATH